MTAGTIVRLADGRVGTVVYNSLDGVGIKWGVYDIGPKDIQGHGHLFPEPQPIDYPWYPEAMLRDPYPGADLECVGRDFEVIDLSEAGAQR